MRHRQRRDGVVFAPQDQSGHSKNGKLTVKLLVWLGEGFEHAAYRVTVAARKVQRVGEIDQLLGDDAFVVEHAFECFAQARASGDVEVDGNRDCAIVDACSIVQYEFFDLMRKAQSKCRDDPSTK